MLDKHIPTNNPLAGLYSPVLTPLRIENRNHHNTGLIAEFTITVIPCIPSSLFNLVRRLLAYL